MMGPVRVCACAGALAGVLVSSAAVEIRARQTSADPYGPDATHTALLDRVKENLRRERQNLLEFTYRERRRPMKVSGLGKVSLDVEHQYDVFPSNDPDRPRRVLAMVAGRPATAAERTEFERKQMRGSAERRARTDTDRRRAQDRFDDAFRVFQFAVVGEERVDGVAARVVSVTPRQHVETKSDLGKWFKKFKGTAWVVEADAELVKVQMTATDTISLGWGVVGRIAEGTTLTYVRQPVESGMWLPARARFEARGRTLLFRSFDVDSVTEWFDYRPYMPVAGGTAARR